jgi:hypothetical protein
VRRCCANRCNKRPPGSDRPRHNAAFTRQSMAPPFDDRGRGSSSRHTQAAGAAIPNTPPAPSPEKTTARGRRIVATQPRLQTKMSPLEPPKREQQNSIAIICLACRPCGRGLALPKWDCSSVLVGIPRAPRRVAQLRVSPASARRSVGLDRFEGAGPPALLAPPGPGGRTPPRRPPRPSAQAGRTASAAANGAGGAESDTTSAPRGPNAHCLLIPAVAPWTRVVILQTKL